MTREEAIKELSCIADEMPSMECANWIKAISMAIKALEQEPICETLTSGYVQEIRAECDDCISRQAAIDAIENHRFAVKDVEQEDDVKWGLAMALEVIERLPSVTPAEKQEPKYCDRNICMANEYNGIGCAECEVTKSQETKMGHWYKKPHEICYTCDQCRTTNASGTKYNFCPHCGAKMQEVKNG